MEPSEELWCDGLISCFQRNIPFTFWLMRDKSEEFISQQIHVREGTIDHPANIYSRVRQTEEALCGDPALDDKLSDKPGFVLRVTRGTPSPSA